MRKLTPATLLTGVLVVAVASCSGSDNGITDPNPTVPDAVLAVDEAERTLAFNQSTALVVQVVDEDENPLGAVTVTFAGSGVEHSLSETTATTSSDGRASITVTAGSEAGVIEVQATAGEATPAVFTLTVEAGAATLAKVSGDEQTLEPEEESDPLVVEVLDEEGDPVEGVTVSFAGSGVAHSLSADSAATDAEGRAEVTVTAGSEDGAIEVVASVDGLDPVTFTLTVAADGGQEATTLVMVSGDEQTLDLQEESEPLVVEVLDQDENPMEGVSVTFSSAGVDHSLSATSATTDSDGRAQVTVTAGDEEGEIEILAEVDGLDPVSFTATVVEAAPLTFEAPGILPRGLAWDGTNLWVVAGESEAPTIYRLDPSDGSVVSSFSAPGTGHRDLAWDGESLWYSAHGQRMIFKIDPSDGSVLHSFSSPRGNEGQPRGLAWDGTSLWHTDAEGPERMVFELDPETGEVRSSFTSPVTLPVALEWDGTHLWTSQLSGSGLLVRFDTSGDVVQSVESPGDATVGLAFDPDGPWMWASDYSEGEDNVLIRRIRVTLDP